MKLSDRLLKRACQKSAEDERTDLSLSTSEFDGGHKKLDSGEQV